MGTAELIDVFPPSGWLPIERVSRYVISSKPAGAADGTFRTVAAMSGDKNEATIDNLPPGVDITVRVVAEVEVGGSEGYLIDPSNNRDRDI